MKIFKTIEKHEIAGLTGELKSIYLNEYFKNSEKSLLLVTNSLYEASKFYQSLSNYTEEILFFPMDDFLTSEALAISPEFKIARLETLKELANNTKKIVVTNLMGYLRFLPSKKAFEKSKTKIEKNKDYKINDLIETLFSLGYTKETIINKTGEIAVRGFVIDIFPIMEENPIRLEFWGDTIDSIRIFNVENQLTIKEIEEIIIYPNTELLLEGNIDTFNLKQRDMINYIVPSNIASYLENGTIFFDDYSQLETSYKMLVEEMIEYSISNNLPETTQYMNELEPFPDSYYFVNFDNITNKNDTIIYQSWELDNLLGNTSDINKKLDEYRKNYNQVIICISNRYKANKIIEELNNPHLILTNEKEIIEDKINIIIKTISEGFIFEKMVVISEKEIFNKKTSDTIYKTNFKMGTKIRDITKLNIGDYIVHSIHGIGRYCGIKTLTKNNLKKDYLYIEYKDNDKLYIPVEKIDMISKYASQDGGIPKVNKLGSIEWEKTKLRAKKRIQDIAGELLKLYALRESSQGFSFSKDNEDQQDFDQQFIYEETKDQLKVIEEIKKDMESPHPMDRLLCGDVGYGKTEVAFRAMFKAVLDGKQVALLCPTTILSSQHFKNALERFQSFPVNIVLLNRFVSQKEISKSIREIKEGKADIVIGTHRILSEDIKFKDLGLLVIDEEQRFGVKHKEKIKEYKNNVDVLTLSATPIPRTLQMSMAGLRSLSLIETPPVDRYPIQTYVLAENNQIIKDAIYKELSRQGQIFILYNRIEDMETKVKEISRIIPDARIISAHGRMSKSELEDVMIKFTNHEYDILLCTTIIETGIDIPSVNTLIIMDADYFGLSQLYQIRGRVGRSNKIAYCYLMYNKGKILSEIAIKRLKAIKEFTELGSGFAIAMRDLSIRGAGDILGSEQAGFIDTIGIELFMEMLNNEIKILKGEAIEEPLVDAQPLLDVETTIDDKIATEEELKIEIHKKINSIDSYEKLTNVKEELQDRFGNLNENIIIYMHEEWFEKLALKLNIKQVNQTKNFIEIILPPELTEKIYGEKLFMEAYQITRMFRLALKNKRLIITLDTVKLEQHFVYYLIELLESIKRCLK